MPEKSPYPASLSAVPQRPRVAFVTSHPIQYQVPVFRHLAARDDLDFVVLFAQIPDAAVQGSGFGVAFEWDIPLLEGYEYRVLNNVSKHPSVTQFAGCDTPEIQSVLKELKIDIAIVNGWVVKTCLQALLACRWLGIPCLVRGEANDLRPRAWWKRFLQQFLVRRYAAVLVIGKANRSFYLSRGIPEHKIFPTPYCVENSRFAKAAESALPRRLALRQQWKISANTVCFLYCGKFEHKKHPLELLQTVKTAVDSGAKLHLLMVGDGELRKDCEAFVAEYQLPVSFTGFLNQSAIVESYVASDVLVVPSDAGETWGLVVNEAMACGLPTIVSDQVGCASDLIQEQVTGWTFPFGDWQRLADLVVQLSEQMQGIHQMASACTTVIADYSPARAADGVVKAVLTVLSDRNKR